VDHTGFEWLSAEGASLGLLQYSTFTESSFRERPCNRVFGSRQGQDASGAKAGTWRPALAAAFVDDTNCSLWLHLKFPDSLSQDYGAPQQLWLSYNFSDASTHVDLQLLWFNKTATRIAESFMFEFTPSVSGSEWWMQKLAAHVRAHDVVQGGNMWQHAVSGGVTFSPFAPRSAPRNSKSLVLSSTDSPLLAPIISSNGAFRALIQCVFVTFCPGSSSPSPLVPHTDVLNATQVTGVAWNLFNNMFAIPFTSNGFCFRHPMLLTRAYFLFSTHADVQVDNQLHILVPLCRNGFSRRQRR
jgi:hypothetical protein